MVTVTVPAGYTTSSQTNTPLNTPIQANSNGVGVISVSRSNTLTPPLTYVFDAVLALEHEQSLTKTRHPVQAGAAVSSHAYIEPASLVLYVLMSDVTPSYVAASQASAPYIQAWSGSSSKSVAAYQTMLRLQSQRVPLVVTTRLRTYYNMLVSCLTPREDVSTIKGARFRVQLEQVFIAGTQIAPISARPNDTASTGLGSVGTQPPSNTVNSQFAVANATGDPSQPTLNFQNWLAANPAGVNVPGAGPWSSSNTNSLQQMPSP
jgi:hypothetical protein